ncbi:hypothetical protein JTE90_012936 [Oedothorax gibbosus]|uniref:Uncharacterized protein n=1 Tax=Oedothorax gibbosus TaxID=931172 RepID=A0AAV6TG48_9ARAC|nr:hypothetical protein JTE90_012936 [Oedothorax gibbosus]
MGTDRDEITYLPPDFPKGPKRGAPDTARERAFTRKRPPLRTAIPPGETKSYKEKIIFPGSSVDVSGVRCVPHLVPKGPISVSGLGILKTPFPFRSANETKPSMCLRLADVSLLERISPDPLTD